ncbi:MAG: DNA polymerase III subunit delta' [Epsilonproteobacteria bacterium]|nr:DNA polymerase III subunit delta' [Campylobacterota bacterium]
MSVDAAIKGHIIISNDIEDEIEKLTAKLQGSRVVKFHEETFKIEHAKEVSAEACISDAKVKYIVIAATEFTDVAQNSLLKIFEEPPSNIEFIIISPTKSNLLPTVRSRLPILQQTTQHLLQEIPISFAKIDYNDIFAFLKEHARVSKNEAKLLVEAMFHKAVVTEQLILSQRQLENFDKAYRLLDLNARAQSVFAMLLMGFVQERR